MGQILAVCSGKGGAGKSTASVLISQHLAKRKRRILLIDSDSGLRCLDSMLCVSDSIIFDLHDVLCGRPAEDAVLSVPDCPGLFLLAAPLKKCNLSGKALTNLLNAVMPCFDYVVFDLPAGIDTELWASFPKTSQFIMIGGTDRITVNGISRAGEELDNLGFSHKMVINRFDPKSVKHGTVANIDKVIDETCCQLLGIVPFDSRLIEPQFSKLILLNGGAFDAYGRIASRIDGIVVPLLNPNKIKKR